MPATCATWGIQAENASILIGIKYFTTPFALCLLYMNLSFLFRLHTSFS